MVARQQAEAPGVDRDAFVDAELGGQVGDAEILGRGIRLLKPGRAGHVGVERFLDPVHVDQEAIVPQQLLHAVLVDCPQQFDGTVFDGVKQVIIQPAEQRDRLVVPAPPHVVRHLVQRLQTLREIRQHGERANRTTGHHHLDPG